MEKLKKLKAEHNHIFTDILKATIFGLIMLAPLLAILSKTMYVTFNKNAKESYYGSTINEIEYVHTNYDELVIGETYRINPINIGAQSSEMGSTSYRISISNIEAVNFTPSNNDFYNAVSFSLYSLPSGLSYVNLYDSDNNNILSINSNNNYIIQYQLVSKNLVGNSINLFNLLNNNLIKYNDYSYLDNAFYYAVDELGEQPLFSWTKNTALYNNINVMTSGLDIGGTTNTLALLLTYWTLITIVYVIMDIVIQIFIKITHFLQD